MNTRALWAGVLLTGMGAALAQPASSPSMVDQAKTAMVLTTCGSSCGTVQEVKQETRKGKGGAVGVIGGAVIGGLLGNQVGGGTGKTLATVGGAAAGGYVGNEVQKKVTSKKVWVTTVKMKDGSLRKFEQEPQPVWTAGNVVRVESNNTLTKQ